MCGKRLGQDDASSCSHNCTLLCHPGPCPSCAAQTVRKCPCGKTSRTVKCGSSNVFLCEATCDKTLSCGVHQCQLPCHAGQCEPCQVTFLPPFPSKQYCLMWTLVCGFDVLVHCITRLCKLCLLCTPWDWAISGTGALPRNGIHINRSLLYCAWTASDLCHFFILLALIFLLHQTFY